MESVMKTMETTIAEQTAMIRIMQSNQAASAVSAALLNRAQQQQNDIVAAAVPPPVGGNLSASPTHLLHSRQLSHMTTPTSSYLAHSSAFHHAKQLSTPVYATPTALRRSRSPAAGLNVTQTDLLRVTPTSSEVMRISPSQADTLLNRSTPTSTALLRVTPTQASLLRTAQEEVLRATPSHHHELLNAHNTHNTMEIHRPKPLHLTSKELLRRSATPTAELMRRSRTPTAIIDLGSGGRRDSAPGEILAHTLNNTSHSLPGTT